MLRNIENKYLRRALLIALVPLVFLFLLLPFALITGISEGVKATMEWLADIDWQEWANDVKDTWRGAGADETAGA